MNSKEKEFKEFYNANFKIVYNYLKQRIPLAEDCVEVVFETFNAIWFSWDNIDKNQNVKGLLFKICKNKLNDFLRRKYSLDQKFSALDSELEETLFFEDSNENNNQNLSLNNKLAKALEKLNETEQKIVQLKYFENLSNTQIAKELNLNIGNVKVINNRLLKKLKNLWEQI